MSHRNCSNGAFRVLVNCKCCFTCNWLDNIPTTKSISLQGASENPISKVVHTYENMIIIMGALVLFETNPSCRTRVGAYFRSISIVPCPTLPEIIAESEVFQTNDIYYKYLILIFQN